MTRLPNTRFHDLPGIAHGKRKRTDGVTIHTIQGTDESAEAWFANRNAGGVGAHIIIGTSHAVQLTDLDNICWHAPGCNSNRIGIEHDGFAENTRLQWLSSARRRELRMSANRTAWICYHYKLGQPTKGTNVIGHVDCPGSDHTDPGKGWPWTFYIWLARRAYKRLVATKGRSWA
jgi:N-acetyl-anhydromuramyl-L-alanine amidase AmpD